MTIEIQFISFFSMLIAGLYLGCMFDTNERISRMFKDKTSLNILFQFIFWLGQSVLIFLSLVKINGGHVRFHFIIAIILGYWLYFIYCRRVYLIILERVIAFVTKIILIIKQIITFLIIKPIIFVVQAFISLLNVAIIVLFKLLSFILKCLEWIFRPVFKIIPENVKKYLVSFVGFYSKIRDRL